MFQSRSRVCVFIALAFVRCSTGNTDVNDTADSTKLHAANNAHASSHMQQDSDHVSSTVDVEPDSSGTLTSTSSRIQDDTYVLENHLTIDSDLEIINRYGNNITHAREYSSEVEGSWPVTILFAGTNESVKFEWLDTTTFSGLSTITIHGKESKWKTKSGVRLGTSLDDLERLNAKPFLFYYLGWNFEGEVSWNGGKLSGTNMYVTVFPKGTADPRLYYPEAPEQISSDSEAARNSGLVVAAITLRKN